MAKKAASMPMKKEMPKGMPPKGMGPGMMAGKTHMMEGGKEMHGAMHPAPAKKKK